MAQYPDSVSAVLILSVFFSVWGMQKDAYLFRVSPQA